MALAAIYILELTRLGFSDEQILQVCDVFERASQPSRDALKSSRDASRDRSKKYRQNKKLTSANVTAPSRDTVARASFFLSSSTEDSESIQVKKESKKVVTPAREQEPCQDDWPVDYRNQFWQAYPHKVGKPRAIAKLDGCRRRGISFAEIMDGLQRYIQTKPPDRPWLNPETFINQERWADRPATITTGGPNGRRTVQDAARDLHEKLLRDAQAFDDPPPSGLCSGTGQTALRLLPSR